MSKDSRMNERFWNKVDRTGDCWIWTGAKTAKGYGNVRCNGKYTKAHRMAWMIAVSEIPIGLCVLHKCDNPQCVRPAHLFLGTQAENMADMKAKGRRAPDMKRDECPQTRIHSCDVVCIRELHKHGYSLRRLANVYGVHHTTIQKICK